MPGTAPATGRGRHCSSGCSRRAACCYAPGGAGLALCAGCCANPARHNGPACARCAGARLPGLAPGLPELSVAAPACGGRRRSRLSTRPSPTPPRSPWLLRRFKFHGDLAAGHLLGGLLAQALRLRRRRSCRCRCTRAACASAASTRRRTSARPWPVRAGRARRHRPPLRVRPTTPQMELPAERRRGNVRHAFALEAARRGRTCRWSTTLGGRPPSRCARGRPPAGGGHAGERGGGGAGVIPERAVPGTARLIPPPGAARDQPEEQDQADPGVVEEGVEAQLRLAVE
ncbi:MAG: hypothetical protein U5K43_09650, partial [Halofilum sp. (in: g-proteobacteria)]|nr:hypothetical protein [Halofilum sp. (in: g-proteobacteria)]